MLNVEFGMGFVTAVKYTKQVLLSTFCMNWLETVDWENAKRYRYPFMKNLLWNVRFLRNKHNHDKPHQCYTCPSSHHLLQWSCTQLLFSCHPSQVQMRLWTSLGLLPHSLLLYTTSTLRENLINNMTRIWTLLARRQTNLFYIFINYYVRI